MHSVTDIQTDGQQAAANSRSYCVAVRSAKNGTVSNAGVKFTCYETWGCFDSDGIT